MDIKKNKFTKIINNFYKKITFNVSHYDYLFKNKFIVQEIYISSIIAMEDINKKILNLQEITNKKKNNKNNIDNLIIEIYQDFEKLSLKFSNGSIKSLLEIITKNEEYVDNLSNEYKNIIELLDNYYIVLSINKVIDNDIFLNKYNIKNNNLPSIIPLIHTNIHKTLFEIIEGATIVFITDKKKCIYINGFFKNDSINICKKLIKLKNEVENIEEDLEYVEIPNDFKEKYIEQISLRDYLIMTPSEITNMIKNDYNELLQYKTKSLSLLIKEFIKSRIEKQRKIIILFLLSDEQSQFTAHIIFDLISEQTFFTDSYELSHILFNSFHWKVQQIFKISENNFESNKKKLETISISDIPYESRILTLNVNNMIKSKAMDKLKEINGSKENSIKAQQWLDGFLKIPFNIYKKEPIIDFFKTNLIKMEKYIDIFTIKISEFNSNILNETNKEIYNLVIQIVDEFHANFTKSENSYSLFINYLVLIKNKLIQYYLEDFNGIIDSCINYEENKKNVKEKIYKDEYSENFENLTKNIDINGIIQSFDTTSEHELEKALIEPSEEIINNCANQLSYFKKIKIELTENNILNKNSLNSMNKKLNELESMLCKKKDDNGQNINDYNKKFNRFIFKNMKEWNEFIDDWSAFRDKKKIYIKNVDKILNKCTYGQTEAKKQMKRIIGQWINGISKGQCFGLCGPPGVGKTTLCKKGFAKCLYDDDGESRPFYFLPLGGATNGSILEGHNYTYVGSTWGKIVDILMDAKCMNPIIYIDELDKISKTEHGKEIISILTHITDQSQNKEFFDRYFSSIAIDLSEVLFIFSYNDRDCIDRILLDRIQEINIKPLSAQEKLVICQNYTCPEICINVGFSSNEIIFEQKILEKIINEYTHEAGVRKLTEILYDIVREINLQKIVNDRNIEIKYPIVINEKFIEEFLSNIPKITPKRIHPVSQIGLVNGLYATASGLGGLTVIQVMKTISDKKFTLERLTGSQGDIMKESMNCAMTLAWNIIPSEIKDIINMSKDGFGLHIHCPEGSTPKDGPSAGLAITLAIISRLCGIPIRNNVAMTGEVDLLGRACEIGGLYSKIQGAYNAGIKTVLIPRDNEKDLDIIFRKEEEEKENIKNSGLPRTESLLLLENNSYKMEDNRRIFRNKMEIYLVNNIFDIIKYSLEDNDLEFIRTF
jgi:endopeptidase La